jgi:hypothetical protein
METTSPLRNRVPGDIAHGLSFFATLIVAVMLTAGGVPTVTRMLAGPPPPAIASMSQEDVLNVELPNLSVVGAADEIWSELLPHALGDRPPDDELFLLALDLSAYADALRTSRARASVMLTALGIAVMGIIAANVGYRSRDGFMVLIPLYGPFGFVPTMLWRLTSPARYWEVGAAPPPLFPPSLRFAYGVVATLLTVGIGMLFYSLARAW